MNLIKSLTKFVLANQQIKKKKNSTASRTNNSSNKEREVQGGEDKDIQHKLLLDNIDVEKWMNEDDLKLTYDHEIGCKE